MLPGSSERFIPIPEGNAGNLITLDRMAEMIREQQPLFTPLARLGPPSATDAHRIFEWVRSHMLYIEDLNDLRGVIEEIKTPEYLLREIATFGSAIGDCDDYVVLYGTIYLARGYGVKLVAIALHEDTLLEHVFLQVSWDGSGWVTCDGIVAEPMGWEVPEREQYARVERIV